MARKTVAALGALLWLALAGPAQAAFPGENGKVVYTRTAGFTSEIWMTNPDGTEKASYLSGAASFGGGSFAPDGQRFAHARAMGSFENAEIAVVLSKLDDPGYYHYLQRPQSLWSLQYSPDGRSVSWHEYTAGTCKLVVYNIALATEFSRPLAPCTADGSRWSPNGERIYVWLNGDLISLSASLEDQRDELDAWPLDFSPDGTRRVYHRFSGDATRYDIYSSRLDGSDEKKLTTFAGSDLSPLYSPDGTKIVFQRYVGNENYDVYTMNADGSGDTALAYSTDYEVPTSWQPLNPPPFTQLVSAPGAATNDTTPTIEFASDTPGATFQCRRYRTDTLTAIPPYTACTSPLTTPELANGAWRVEVRAVATKTDPSPLLIDFVVDTVAPQANVLTGPQGHTGDWQPSFAFSASEAGTAECRLRPAASESEAFSACTSPYTAPNVLSDGDYVFEVRATDRAGNVGEPAARAFHLDTTPPPVTIEAKPPALVNVDTVSFSFGSADPEATFVCRLDDQEQASACPADHEVSGLGEGEHTLWVQAVDIVGNITDPGESWTFVVDTVAPVPLVTGGPDGPTADATPTFTLDAGEAGASATCWIDEATPVACVDAFTPAVLADGPHTLHVRAMDAAGNSGEVSQDFVVDTVAPEPQVTGGPSGPTADTTPTFTLDAGEAGATATCWIDDAAPVGCVDAFTPDALADGPHTLHVRAVDAAGNEAEAFREFLVDTVAPVPQVTGGPSGPVADATPTFTLDAGEAGAATTCWIDDAAPAACAGAFTPDALADGPHTLHVRSVDPAGNAAQTSRDFSVDTTGPGTTITSHPPASSTDTTADFGFTSDEAGVTFECRVDDAAFAACTPVFTTAALAPGAHRFEVRALDALGNPDPTPAGFDFVVEAARTPDPAPHQPPAPAPTPVPTAVPNQPPAGAPGEAPATPSLTVAAAKLKPLLAKGLQVRLSCPAGCAPRIRLTVSRATARRLKLRGTRLASRTGRAGTAHTLALKPGKSVAKRLRRVRRRFTVQVTVQLGEVTLRRSVTVRPR